MSSWMDRIGDVVSITTSYIPYAGFVISPLVALFWPESEEDIWSLISKQTEAMIDQKILDKELEQSESDLESISEYLDNYNKYEFEKNAEPGDSLRRSSSAKADYLSDAIHHEVLCFNRFKNSSNAHLIIPLTVTLSLLHLACLRELYQFGSVLYNESGKVAETNTKNRLKDLCDKYVQYKTLLKSSFDKWLAYRESMISISYPFYNGPIKSAGLAVSDAMTGENFKYSVETTDSNFFVPLGDSIRQRLINQTTTDFISEYLSASFCLDKYLPAGVDVNDPGGFSGDPAVSRTSSEYMGYEKLKYGPYSPATLGISKDAARKAQATDKPGVVKSILVREYNSIDGLQFFYTDHDGNFIGSKTGGAAHTIECGKDNVFTGMNLRFANGLACSVEVTRYDTAKGEPAASSGVLGNRSHWSGKDVAAEINGEWYRLCGGSFAYYTGPSSTIGLGYIEMEFTATKI